MPNQDILVPVKYGSIELMTKYPFNKPTKEVFESWKKDFLKIKEVDSFDIYLLGSFLEKLSDDNIEAYDIDIVLMGDGEIKKVEKLIYEGTKLGLEKYNTFFDILWFSDMPYFNKLWDKQEVLIIDICLLSPEFLIDGHNINKPTKNTKQLSKNLWKVPSVMFPTKLQLKKMFNGFTYSKPMLIN